MRQLARVCFLLFLGTATAAGQETTAQTAAEEILHKLSNQEFKNVWDKHTSDWLKNNTSEDAFLASMSMGRPQLGSLKDIQIITREHATQDPITGFEGTIYAITFRNSYTVGDFYERIVVVKDPDGQFRLAGIYGSAVPKN